MSSLTASVAAAASTLTSLLVRSDTLSVGSGGSHGSPAHGHGRAGSDEGAPGGRRTSSDFSSSNGIGGGGGGNGGGGGGRGSPHSSSGGSSGGAGRRHRAHPNHGHGHGHAKPHGPGHHANSPLARLRLLHTTFIAALLVASLWAYFTTLAPIPRPEDIKYYIPRMAGPLALAVVALSGAIIYATHVGHYAGRGFTRTVYAVVAAEIVCLYWWDAGTSLHAHGLYNFLMLVVPTAVIVAAAAATHALASVLRLKQLAGWVGGTALTVAVVVWAMKVHYRPTWAAAITGLRTGPPGTSVPVQRWEPTGRVVTASAAWQGCDFRFDDVTLPIMDAMPTGAFNFWLGDWRHCPQLAPPAFTATITLQWAAFADTLTAAGIASAAPPPCALPAPLRRHWSPPATIRVGGCPVSAGLRLTVMPDSRNFTAAEKGEFDLQPSSLPRMASRTLVAPADDAGGEAEESPALVDVDVSGLDVDAAGIVSGEVGIPQHVWGEVFVVSCGDLGALTLSVARPDLATLTRVAARWPTVGSRLATMVAAPAASEPAAPEPAAESTSMPDVMVIMLDAVSRQHFKRKLPLTVAVLAELGGLPTRRTRLGGGGGSEGSDDSGSGSEAPMHMFEYMRHHAVGYTTGEITIPMYTGGEFKAAADDPVYEAYAREGGYAVAWLNGMCEDWAGSYPRFRSSRDHELLTYACTPEAHPLGHPFGVTNGPYSIRRRCLGSRYVHAHMLDYASSFWHTYGAAGVPRYLHATFLEGHEGTGDVLETLDADLAAFLRDTLLGPGGSGRNTLLYVLADHGLHMGLPMLWSTQAGLEHMNPALFVGVPRLPPAAPRGAAAGRHCLGRLLTDAAMDALAANQHALVSAYDLFWTWRHVLDVCAAPTASGPRPDTCAAAPAPDLRPERHPDAAPPARGTAASLWSYVPETRTCEDARVPPFMCMCVDPRPRDLVSVTPPPAPLSLPPGVRTTAAQRASTA